MDVEEKQLMTEISCLMHGNECSKVKIRDKDVKEGGPYEADLKRGITKLLEILRVNKEEIGTGIAATIRHTDQVRVVPLGIQDFKSQMFSYRDNKRNLEERVAKNICGTATQVMESLRGMGYELIELRIIIGLVQEDFEAGDIPIIHYNGTRNELTWNGQVVGRRPDYEHTKENVDQNIEWILTRTVSQITESLQNV